MFKFKRFFVLNSFILTMLYLIWGIRFLIEYKGMPLKFIPFISIQLFFIAFYWIYIAIYREFREIKKIRALLSSIFSLTMIPVFAIGIFLNLYVDASDYITIDLEEEVFSRDNSDEEVLLNNYHEFKSMVDRFNDKYNISSDDFKDSERKIEIWDKTEEERDEIIEFLSNKKFKVPNQSVLKMGVIANIFTLELGKVVEELESENYESGIKRYNKLWLMMANLLESEGDLIYHLVGMKIINQLTETFFTYNHLIRGEDVDRAVVDKIIKEYDSSYIRGLKRESNAIREMLMKNEEMIEFKGKSKWMWPLIDWDITLKKLQEYFQAHIRRVREPFYKWEYKKDIHDKFTSLSLKDYLINYRGNQAMVIFLPRFDKGNLKHVEMKSRLLIFRYVIGDFKKIPIDPLTGTKFEVRDRMDYVIIKSHYFGKDGTTIRYRVEK